MLIVTDIYGNTEAVTGYKGLKRYRNTSGERTIKFLLVPTDQNAHSFDLVQEESLIEFKGELFRIKQLKEKPRGKTKVKEVVAIRKMFDLINSHQYEVKSGSMTFEAALQFVLGGTGYTWDVVDAFSAQSFENFGDDNRVALFQEALKRYGSEFDLVDKHFTFKRKIGTATDFQFRYGYNIKTIDRSVNTNNLSTYIKGFGKGVTTEYISPNAGKFVNPDSPDGYYHAKPVRDERYTTTSGLLERLKKEIRDEPELSITIDFVDMRRQGFPYDVPNEGDEVFLIYEPLDLDVEARIMEVEEEFVEGQEYPIRTNVTLANFKKSIIKDLVNFKQTQKQVGKIMDGSAKLPYSVLDDAVLRATEALKSAQTELEFENGIIARSKDNPNHLVLITSAGIGVSNDNGATFRTAVMGDGIVADLITVGTMLFDRVKGGTLTLGGTLNGNGRMQVFNENGEVIADLDAETGGFQELYIGKVNSPSVYNVNTQSKSFNVSTNGGISDVLSNLDNINNAVINITLQANITDDVEISDFLGNGSIYINLNGYKLNGSIFIVGNSPQYININGGTVNSKHPDFCIRVDRCSYVRIENVKVYGNKTAYRGIYVHSGSAAFIQDCEVYDTVNAGIVAATSAHVTVMNAKGKGGEIGVHAFWGGIIYVDGSIPTGTVSDVKEVSGEVLGETTSTGGTPAPPPPPETTKTWYANDANNWSTSGYWSNDDVKQGNYGYGTRTGYWFFPNDIASTLTGKSIKSMRCYIKRKSSGGSSAKVPIRVHWHTYADKPSGAPSNLDLSGSEEAVINLAWGQEGWVNLPSSFFNNFESGEAKGLGVYAGSSRSEYAVLDGYCRFEVTYE